MSLVAYNASDESDGEESDGGNSPRNKTQNSKGSSVLGHISDEEEFETVSSTSVSTASSLLTPLSGYGTNHTTQSTINVDLVDSTSIASLEDLPAPRSNLSEVIQEENELEDEVKPKPSEIKNAQKPPDKKKQPVKITIPSLDKTEIDEDDVQKKPVPSLKKSGLFSLLPPPIHSAKKEINRPLIPHTLTKKPQTTAQASSQAKIYKSIQKSSMPVTSGDSSKSITTKKIALNVAMYGSDSDNEDDDVSASNFFSLDSSSKPAVLNRESTKNVQSEEVSSSEASRVPSASEDVQMTATNSGRKIVSAKSANSDGDDDSKTPLKIGPEPGAVNDAPLDFGHVNNSRLWSSSSSSSFSQSYLGAVGLAKPVASNQNSLQGHYTASASAQYNMVNTEVAENGSFDTVGDDDLKQFMSDKEFQRLSGKRKRGLEDAINFVDANVDDYVDPSEVSKHLTEETEYVSHKNKDNMPTAQQRRKKQITYLAYQAKERELELKNNWAQNRMTKKQTQSKYGF